MQQIKSFNGRNICCWFVVYFLPELRNSLSLSLPLFLSLSLCMSLCLSLYLFLFISLSLSLFLFLSPPVVLEAPDTVLIERAAGKRVDTKTGGKYFLVHMYSVCDRRKGIWTKILTSTKRGRARGLLKLGISEGKGIIEGWCQPCHDTCYRCVTI